MHDIPRNDHHNLKEKLKFISKRWNFISPDDLTDYFSGKIKLKGRNVLLTFDDGFHSNRVIADRILDPLGIKALFFVVGNFVQILNDQNATEFIKNQLYPKWRGHEYPENLAEMKNMNLEDLKHLDANGHSIGFHTENHKNLAKIELKSELKEEIIEGAIKLEQSLGISIDHFSFGFGNVEFFSKAALDLASSPFDFIYTGMRGNNAFDTSKIALRRDTISLEDSNIQIASFLEGSADSRYYKDLELYESWID